MRNAAVTADQWFRLEEHRTHTADEATIAASFHDELAQALQMGYVPTRLAWSLTVSGPVLDVTYEYRPESPRPL